MLFFVQDLVLKYFAEISLKYVGEVSPKILDKSVLSMGPGWDVMCPSLDESLSSTQATLVLLTTPKVLTASVLIPVS